MNVQTGKVLGQTNTYLQQRSTRGAKKVRTISMIVSAVICKCSAHMGAEVEGFGCHRLSKPGIARVPRATRTEKENAKVKHKSITNAPK